MKLRKLMAIFICGAMLCSCAESKVDDEAPKSTDPTEIVTTVQTEPVETTDAASKEENTDRKAMYRTIRLKYPQEDSKVANETYEKICKLYPDKNVLVWQLDPKITPPSSAVISDYLDSLGKNYAVYFRTAPDLYRDSEFSGMLSYTLYGETVGELIEQGEQIDIIDAYSIYGELSLKGYLEPLDGYFADTEAGQNLYEMMPKNFWRGCEVGGKVYGFCSYLTLGMRSGCYVNSFLADKYGYDVNKPILDQLDILNKVKGEPCDTVMTWKSFYEPSSQTTGILLDDCVLWDDDAKEAKSILSDSEYVEVLRTYFELAKEGLVTQQPIRDSFFIYEQSISCPVDGETVIDVPYKTLTSGETSLVPVYLSSQSGTYIKSCGIGTGIMANSEHKAEAFDLLVTAFTDEHLNNLLSYGEDYRGRIQDGRIFTSGRDLVRSWVFLNPIIAIPPMTEPLEWSEQWVKGVESAYVSEDVGFVLDMSGLERTSDAIHAVNVEMARELFSQEYETFEDYLKEFAKRLDEAGEQEIIAAADSQYETWNN